MSPGDVVQYPNGTQVTVLSYPRADGTVRVGWMKRGRLACGAAFVSRVELVKLGSGVDVLKLYTQIAQATKNDFSG